MGTLRGHLSAITILAATMLAFGINVDDAAPDFTLTDTEGQEHSLSDYEGEVVVLFFLGCT